jgi:hypothetical protein
LPVREFGRRTFRASIQGAEPIFLADASRETGPHRSLELDRDLMDRARVRIEIRRTPAAR